ncbi:hypothetical protein SAMN05192583_1153 [Sphingomonas gellani]|uniref:Uncharacterized protein n=1 Tax=Sphingomonas gellani TaxID=1166340 RepID=A0A1H8B1C6_9SPHN|nr:hypothetical protein [Sphingomonas gellani]SEM76593.1 hypothetical protein SAMN05192583_1153 [Sphingomonas gellani]
MSMIRRPDDPAYHALIRGLFTVQRRIAPLWAVEADRLSHRQRILRDRVTANCLRELDVLLAHWVNRDAPSVEPPSDEAEASQWMGNDGMEPGSERTRPMRYDPAAMTAITASYWLAAHASSALHGCELLS